MIQLFILVYSLTVISYFPIIIIILIVLVALFRILIVPLLFCCAISTVVTDVYFSALITLHSVSDDRPYQYYIDVYIVLLICHCSVYLLYVSIKKKSSHIYNDVNVLLVHCLRAERPRLDIVPHLTPRCCCSLDYPLPLFHS